MSKLLFFVIVAFSPLCLAWTVTAETIDVFPFEPPAQAGYEASRLALGPHGDLWFCLADEVQMSYPSYRVRLMRASEEGLECLFAVSPWWGAPDVSIAPDGTMYLQNCKYEFSLETGLGMTSFRAPDSGYEHHYSLADPGQFDAEGRVYCMGTGYDIVWKPVYSSIYEMFRDQDPLCRLSTYGVLMYSPLIVSAEECWVVCSTTFGHRQHWLAEFDLETGAAKAEYEYDEFWGEVRAKDAEGVLWLNSSDETGIVTFDGKDFSVFAQGEYRELVFGDPVLAADGTVWYEKIDPIWWDGIGIARFRDGETRTFTTKDGLLANGCFHHGPVIDYDGTIWLLSSEICPIGDGFKIMWVGLSRIADGGWPPMRLMLHEAATEGTIAVEAQVINNGPVVGVDVYIALEMNGQLLYWPNWQPEPFANQINLRPGHNQTATVIEARREDIPPGSYTFWGCMTGRNTSKLIGPIDRKFESLTIEVGSK